VTEPSYFDDEEKAKALKAEARSWLGTPFRQYYQQSLGRKVDLKGIGGGIDCVGLVQEIMARVGASEDFIIPRDPGDYQSHQTGEKVLDWLRGKIDDPQSKRLAEIMVEITLPAHFASTQGIMPCDFFKPGDVCVLRHGSLFHLPIIIDHELRFVNALPRVGVIEGTMQDSTFSSHLVAVFRLRR